MTNKFENHEDFFKKCGEGFLQPKEFGECFYPVTIEEMYQHFKSRLAEELVANSDELMNFAELKVLK